MKTLRKIDDYHCEKLTVYIKTLFSENLQNQSWSNTGSISNNLSAFVMHTGSRRLCHHHDPPGLRLCHHPPLLPLLSLPDLVP